VNTNVGASRHDFGTKIVGASASYSIQLTVTVPAGQDVDLDVEVVGEGFGLDSASTLSFASDPSVEKTETSTLQFSYAPAQTGSHSGELTVREGSTVLETVTLSGTAIDDPWIDARVTSVDFGTTTVGATEVSSVVVEVPDGSYTLDLQYSGDSEISLEPTGTKTVTGPTAVTVTCTFGPSAAQGYSGSLDVSWTGPDSTSGTLSTVSLSGTGIEEGAADDATSTDGVASAQDSTSTQRAVFYVPTYESIVGLGERYASQDGTVATQKGFSMTSTRHVFLRAGGSATVQAEGNCWVQSTAKDVYLLSGSHSSWAASEQLYLGAAGYTGVFSGYGGDMVDASNQDDANLSKPEAVGEIDQCITTADIVWGVTDGLLDILNRGKDLHEFVVLDKWREKGWKGWKKVWNWAKTGGFLLWSTYNIISYIISSIRLLPLQAVSLHAPGGILAGTPSYHSMWGFSVATTSFNNTQIGIVGLSYESGYRSVLDAVWGEASVLAGKNVNLLALTYWKHAARWDSINYYGKDVVVGGLTPSGKQLLTLEMAMGAVGKASFKALTPSTSKVTVGEGSSFCAVSTVKLTTQGKAKYTQGNRFVIEGPVYTFECTPTMISISNGVERLITLTPGSVTFGKAAANIQMLPAAANIGAGAIQVTPASIIANAGVVELL